ncbi:MAG: hypothetical protein JO236_15180 [Mycobacterium sp.]|uniref:hypothetical protein n=1 Tax=Mycobacterium sp. TaxID=1785 RepID=UPI001EB75EFD|nr:hypothetical protein [Mycobacterium sp.]MBW0018870.1 hypothetical protein [Mycobacterium sp.]
MSDNEGIGVLRLECPQHHPVGRILKQVSHQMVQYDPGAAAGDRRFWPDEDEHQQFKTRCGHCDRSVGESTATLQAAFAALLADPLEFYGNATLAYAP